MLRSCLFLIALGFLFATSSFADSTFRVRLVADPQTFDWNLATTPMETPLLMNIMEGLVDFDSHMKVRPALAKSWTVSEDQKTYTFKLRTDVKWSDGKQMTANDFLYSWQRLLNPLLASAYAYLIFDIEGAEDYNSRKISDFSKVAIKALDPFTIQIKLRRPVSYFIQMFTFWVTFPVRQDMVEKYGVAWTQPGKMVVLGPFIPASYQAGSQLTLKRNELYYGKRPALDTVIMRIINEDTTALNLFKAGQLDFVRPINFLEMGNLRSSPAFHSDPYLRTCFINFNTQKYPFNLPKVRQATALAIDRSKLTQVVHNSVQETNTLVPTSLFPEGKGIGIGFNPELAKKTLAETGINPSTTPHFEFMGYASDENALLMQYLQDQLKKNLGFNLDIQLPEFKMFRTQLELQTSTLYYRCWGADYADPDSFFDVFTSTSGNNRTGWKNAEYDSLVKKAATLPSTSSERTHLYKEALEILLKKETVIIPLHNDSFNYLLNTKVKNFSINPLNYVFFKDIVLEK